MEVGVYERDNLFQMVTRSTFRSMPFMTWRTKKMMPLTSIYERFIKPKE